MSAGTLTAADRDAILAESEARFAGVPTPRVADPLLSADQAAELLQVSAWQVREWAKAREIPALRLGRFWRFRSSSLNAWLAEKERGVR